MGRTIPRELGETLALYQPWTCGAMPVAGGVLDQAATFLDAMKVYGGEIARIEAEDMEEMRRESERVR